MVGDDSGRVYAAACYCVAAEALATRPEVTVGHRCHGRTLRASLDPKNYVSRFFPAGFRAHDPFANITGGPLPEIMYYRYQYVFMCLSVQYCEYR